MSEQKPSHEVEGFGHRALRQSCVEAQIWGRVPTMSESLVPKITVASIILKLKKFGTTKTLPRAGCPAKLSNQGRRALVREVTKYLMVTLRELLSSSVEMGEPSRWTTMSAALHQSGLFGRVARQKPFLSNRHMTARLEFAKGTFPAVKHGGGSIMLWGCFSAVGTWRLFRMEGNMNGKSIERSLMKTCSRVLRTRKVHLPTGQRP